MTDTNTDIQQCNERAADLKDARAVMTKSLMAYRNHIACPACNCTSPMMERIDHFLSELRHLQDDLRPI